MASEDDNNTASADQQPAASATDAQEAQDVQQQLQEAPGMIKEDNDTHHTPAEPADDGNNEDDDAALAAMMAFQEEQDEGEIQTALDNDDEDEIINDPNIAFLGDDEDDEVNNNDDGQQGEILHPNANNPAALALRARQALQNQQRAHHQIILQNQSLLRRTIGYFTSMRYTPLSLMAAFVLIHYTLRTRQQFYLTVIYLQSSKLSYIVLGNAIIALAISTFSFVTHLFLDGGLRVNERDAIGEHIRWDVTETCLALTIFRSELDVATAVMFLGLVIMKW